MNTQRIKKRTNLKIGYELWKREEEHKMRKIRNITITLIGVAFFTAGTFTVNAMTDNKIVDSIKEVFTKQVKVDGEQKNAKCETLENGDIKCTLDKEVFGKENRESTIEIASEYKDKLEVDVSTTAEEDTITIRINE